MSRKFVLSGLASVVLLSLSGTATSAADIPALGETELLSVYRPGGLRGQLRPVSYTVISAGVSAQLLNMAFKVGETVKAGQVLAEFDCRVQQASTAVAQGKLEGATQKLAVNRRLQELGDASTLELALNEAEVSIADAELKREQALMADCVVRAPFDGTVTDKPVQAYQYVNRGEPLFELVDTHHLEVEMVVPSTYLKNFRSGSEFSIHLDETDTIVKAQLSRISGVVDPVSQTVKLIGRISDDAEGLLPGMSGNVSLPDDLIP